MTLCKTNQNGTSPTNLVNAVPQINKNFVLIEEGYKDFNQSIKHLDNNNNNNNNNNIPMIIQL